MYVRKYETADENRKAGGRGRASARSSPLVQASAPRSVRPRGLATLGKPFCREFLFYPRRSLSRSMGSGLCVAREPRLPRTRLKQCRARSRSVSSAKVQAWHAYCYSVRHMQIVRRHLAWIAGAWLLGQVAAIAAAPLALHRATAVGVEDDCCPGVAPGQVCPMHHTREGKRTCEMRNACSSDNAALLSLAGGTGLPATANSIVVRDSAVDRIAPVPSITLARSDRPDSPPPRS
jgi:hypothetical protein